MFEGYAGGIRVVFEGIQMVFRVFGLSGMCKTIAGVAFAEESHPPKFTFYNIKRGNDDFRESFSDGLRHWRHLLRPFRILPTLVF